MKSYTAHVKPDCPPVLLLEGWSWGAAIFGPFWLLAHRAWIPALLFAALALVIQLFTPPGLSAVIALGLGVLSGLLGRDAVRWSLERRGYMLAHVVAARDHESALARLLHARTDLGASLIGQLG
jgi:hypothetical protein